MGKILFVEDELHVKTLKRYFGNFLTKELAELDNERNRMLIKEKLSTNSFVRVEFNFIDALKTILAANASEFSLYIFDRNLDPKAYNAEEAYSLAPKIVLNPGREGDFLFTIAYDKLSQKKKSNDALKRLYFLTAYPSDRNEIEKLLGITAKQFPEENIILKSPGHDDCAKKNLERFKNEIIPKFLDLDIKEKYAAAFKVFDLKLLDSSDEDQLVNCIRSLDVDDPDIIKKEVGIIRSQFEKALKAFQSWGDKIFKEFNFLNQASNPNTQSKDDNTSNFINFLNGSYFRNGCTVKCEEIFSNTNFIFTLWSLWKASCGIAQHGKPKGRQLDYVPTIHTLHIVLHSYLDFLAWMGEFCQRN